MNSTEYLEFFGRLYGRQPAETRKKAAELLERFGLGPARSKRLGEYSKGMRQKLALVRALLHDPPVLLLDEPTSAMDPESARMVRDAIHTLRSVDRTIILCTHNLVEADELADQVAIIRNGKILLNDTTHEIKRQLLGPAEFEARLSVPWLAPQDWPAALPEHICLTQKTSDCLYFQVQNPVKDNPLILQWLLSAGAQVVSYAEVARSLEQAYLEAVSRVEKGESRV